MIDGIPNRPLYFDQKDIIDWVARDCSSTKDNQQVYHGTIRIEWEWDNPSSFLFTPLSAGSARRALLPRWAQLETPLILNRTRRTEQGTSRRQKMGIQTSKDRHSISNHGFWLKFDRDDRSENLEVLEERSRIEAIGGRVTGAAMRRQGCWCPLQMSPGNGCAGGEPWWPRWILGRF